MCASDAPAVTLPSTARDSLGYPFGKPGTEDLSEPRASLSRKIPGGWGGVTRREKGLGFAIFLIDTTQRRAALEALVSAGINYVSLSTEVRQGRWTYAQIYDWFRYIHSHLRHVAVTMWSLDEDNNRILYGVENKAAASELDRQLTAMNVPCFLVAREVTGPVYVTGANETLQKRQ